MILSGRFSRRRKLLLAIMALLLAWVGYAWYAGIAITQGIEESATWIGMVMVMSVARKSGRRSTLSA